MAQKNVPLMYPNFTNYYNAVPIILKIYNIFLNIQ